VIEIHRRQEHRHVRLVAKRRRRGDHRHLLGEAWLEHLGRVALHRREHEVDTVRGHLRRVLDVHLRELVDERPRAEPRDLAARVLDRVAVFLAGRALGRAQLHHLELRMARQRRQELLTGNTRGTQNGNANT